MNFLRIEKPVRASQMSECHGAGTGCGWCRPYLKQLFEASQASSSPDATDATVTPDLPSADDYARGRTAYVREGKGTPPAGGTPIL